MKTFVLLLVFVPRFALAQDGFEPLEYMKAERQKWLSLVKFPPELRAAKTLKAGEPELFARIKKGQQLINDGSYDEAFTCFDEAIKLNPTFAQAYANRGYVLGKKMEFDKAIQDCNEAIRLDPNYIGSYETISGIFLTATSPDNVFEYKSKAIAASRKACRLTDWQDHRRIHNLATLNSLLMEHDEAIRFEMKAIEAANGKGDDTTQYAKALDQIKKKKDLISRALEGMDRK